ncbi:MAG: hypothetical protein H7834_03630 [Magnetococcus sp. YQC-9]
MLKIGWPDWLRLRLLVGLVMFMGVAGCTASPEPIPSDSRGSLEMAAAPVSQPQVADVGGDRAAPGLDRANQAGGDQTMMPAGRACASCPCCKKACAMDEMKAGKCGKMCKSCGKSKKCKKACQADGKVGKSGKKCELPKGKCDHDYANGNCCAKCGKDKQRGKKCELPGMTPGLDPAGISPGMMMEHHH